MIADITINFGKIQDKYWKIFLGKDIIYFFNI